MPNTSKRVEIDPFIEKLSNLVNESLLEAYWYEDFPNSDDMAKYLIANGVTIPVRCKDCKHCRICYPEKQIGKEATQGWYCKEHKSYRRPDDFCSYGERRTDG